MFDFLTKFVLVFVSLYLVSIFNNTFPGQRKSLLFSWVCTVGGTHSLAFFFLHMTAFVFSAQCLFLYHLSNKEFASQVGAV